jgi:hypothetical protein
MKGEPSEDALFGKKAEFAEDWKKLADRLG